MGVDTVLYYPAREVLDRSPSMILGSDAWGHDRAGAQMFGSPVHAGEFLRGNGEASDLAIEFRGELEGAPHLAAAVIFFNFGNNSGGEVRERGQYLAAIGWLQPYQ